MVFYVREEPKGDEIVLLQYIKFVAIVDPITRMLGIIFDYQPAPNVAELAEDMHGHAVVEEKSVADDATIGEHEVVADYPALKSYHPDYLGNLGTYQICEQQAIQRLSPIG